MALRSVFESDTSAELTRLARRRRHAYLMIKGDAPMSMHAIATETKARIEEVRHMASGLTPDGSFPFRVVVRGTFSYYRSEEEAVEAAKIAHAAGGPRVRAQRYSFSSMVWGPIAVWSKYLINSIFTNRIAREHAGENLGERQQAC